MTNNLKTTQHNPHIRHATVKAVKYSLVLSRIYIYINLDFPVLRKCIRICSSIIIGKLPNSSFTFDINHSRNSWQGNMTFKMFNN